MKNTIKYILLIITSLFMLTGCEDTKEEKSTLNSGVKNEEKNETNDETKTNNNDKDFTPVDGIGTKYVNYDSRNFAINGKVYTLGKTTLKELIDDGVPFTKNALNNAENNINKNYESQTFEIELAKNYSASVRVFNDSDDGKKASDCKLSYIYLPVNHDKEQNILSFAFPLTVTEEEIIANSGEPTDTSDYQGNNGYYSKTLEYKVKSTKYLGSSGYKFQFTNGKLAYITITYQP